MRHPLILLFGLPRSGTTWIGKIFDSHPDTLYRHEPDSWGRLNNIPLLVERGAEAKYCDRVASFVEALPVMRETKVSATLPVFKKSYLSAFQYTLFKGFIRTAKMIARVKGECRVPRLIDIGEYENIHIVWKSIESLGRLGLIMECMPDSRAVHIIRHPCGQIASILRGEASRRFTSGTLQSEDYGIYRLLSETEQAKRRGLQLEKFREMSSVERLAWRWVIFNEKAMEDAGDDEKKIILRYEDMCHDPFSYTEKILDDMGLAIKQETIEFIKQSTVNEISSYYSIYKDSRTSANRWINELPRGDVSKIMDIVSGSTPGQWYPE